MFDDLIRFMSKLVRRAEAPETPKSVKNEIKSILETTAQDVASGTKRIEDQIEELKEIERRLFDDPEMTLKPVTEKVVGQEPLDELLGDLAKKTGASQEEVRRVLIERANEGYPPGDPKRMLDEDDERLRAFIQTQKLMNREEDLMLDILENAEIPEEQLQGIRALAEEDIDVPPMPDETKEIIESLTEMPATFKDLGKTDVGIEKPKGMIVTEDTVDRAIDANKQRQRDLERAEELMMDPENFGKSFDEIMQMVQDEKVIPFMKFQPNPKPKKAEGGIISRVGLQDGGGPKISRRGFLGMLGAGIGSLFMPRGAKQIAESVAPAARIIKPAPGMPDWFPLLVNQIKSKGKITREPDYKDFTSGGDTTVRYKLKDDSLSGGEIFLEEDLQSGTVGIFGRGDDGQQVSMDYFPGARTATKKGVKEDPPTFEAGEFFKGEIQDFENIGVPTDDLRGGLLSWEKLSGFNLTPREKIQRMMKKFEDDYKDPNVEPDDDIINMSQGGGVGSLFKERTV
jgi:hypothetical protein